MRRYLAGLVLGILVSTALSLSGQITGGGGGTSGSTVNACADTRVVFADGANNLACDAGLTFNKTTDALTALGPLAGTTLDTGQGANELYDMDQNVLTSSTPQFAGVQIGSSGTTFVWDNVDTVLVGPQNAAVSLVMRESTATPGFQIVGASVPDGQDAVAGPLSFTGGTGRGAAGVGGDAALQAGQGLAGATGGLVLISGGTAAGGTNLSGGKAQIIAGAGTGNATTAIEFFTPTVEASGTTEQTLTKRGTMAASLFTWDGTVDTDALRVVMQTPASASATCTKDTFAFDTGFLYVCTATDTWKRVAIATW